VLIVSSFLSALWHFKCFYLAAGLTVVDKAFFISTLLKIVPRTQDIGNLVFEIATYYANDSPDTFVKRNLLRILPFNLKLPL
jgi:hypothetical protein